MRAQPSQFQTSTASQRCQMPKVYAAQIWITVEAETREEAMNKASSAACGICVRLGTLEAAKPAYEVSNVIQVADERVEVSDGKN